MAHKNKKQVALYLTEDEIEKVSKYSELYGISKQQLLRNLISTGLDEISILRKMGIMSLALVFRSVGERFRRDTVVLEEDSSSLDNAARERINIETS